MIKRPQCPGRFAQLLPRVLVLLGPACLLGGAEGGDWQPSRQVELLQLLRLPDPCTGATPGCGALIEGRLASPAAGTVSTVGPQASGISVVSAASLGPAVAPGEWIAIRGLELASTTRTWGAGDFNGNVLPTTLSGTSVRVGTRNAAISYVSPTQINALIPPDVPPGQTVVTVTSPVGGPASATVQLEQFAPDLFRFGPENSRYVAAVFPDGSFAGKQGLFPSSPTLTRPVKGGQRCALFATGLGTTNPPLPVGLNFTDPRLMNGAEFFKVIIGGQSAQVEFVGAVSPGLYQINLIAPALTSGDYPVRLEYGSAVSPQGPMITIQGDPAQSRLVANPAPLAMQAFVAGTSPTVQSLQLLSTGEDFDFTLQSSAPWLTFDRGSGRTPVTVRVIADARTLALGRYNERITVLAPGTATPSTTIPVNVEVSNTPQITISRTSLNYQLVTGFQSIDVLVNVLSPAGRVPFTVTRNGGSWLSVPTSGTTPAAVRVTLSSGELAPGPLTGSLRITPAGGGESKDVTVNLTVLAAGLPGGPVRLVALDEDEVLLGRQGPFGVYGQNLSSGTSVSISPPQGIKVEDFKIANASRANMNLLVAADAAEGLRTLTMTTPQGGTNSLQFRVRRGQPQISEVKPIIFNPGRFYATNGSAGSMGDQAFEITGVDVQGVTDIFVDPADDVEALWSSAAVAPSKLFGYVLLGAGARTGPRRLGINTASGPSNSVPIEVRAASPNAPAISNFTVNSSSVGRLTQFSSPTVTYSGKLEFTDRDGDVAKGGKIILMALTGKGSDWQWLVVDDGAYLEQPGKTASAITFYFQKTFIFFYNQITGTIPVLCMIQDAAGNLSNIQVASVSTWQVPVF